MFLTVTLNPCIDHTMFVEGLHPHDSNKIVHSETDAGGKGVNLSRMVVELGGKTLATGFLGGEAGDYVCSVLTRKGVAHDFVEVHPETRTNISVESGDGPPTVFSAKGPQITGFDWENLIAKISTHAKNSDWVVLGGSLPPGVPVESYKILGELVKSCGAKLLIDADGEAMRHGLEAGPDMVKPNKDEAERLLGKPINNLKDAIESVKKLRQRLIEKGSPDPVAVISLGSRGAVVATSQGVTYGVPPKIEVKSTIGSGDSFLAGYLIALSQTKDHNAALRLATAAGAATALSDGTRIGSKQDTDRFAQQVAVRRDDELTSDNWLA